MISISLALSCRADSGMEHLVCPASATNSSETLSKWSISPLTQEAELTLNSPMKNKAPNFYKIVDQAIALNQLGKLGEGKISFDYTVEDPTAIHYLPDTITIHLSQTPSLTDFYHESAHALMDVFYNCYGEPYYCNEHPWKDYVPFRVAAYFSAKALSVALQGMPVDATYKDVLFSLKENSLAGVFWLNMRRRINRTTFIDIIDYPLSEAKYIPFSDPIAYYLSHIDSSSVCVDEGSLIFVKLSQLLLPMAHEKFLKIFAEKGYTREEVSALEQMSTLVFYPSEIYGAELIARAIELSAYAEQSPLIYGILQPLFQFLEQSEFGKEVNKLYEENKDLVDSTCWIPPLLAA